MLGRGPRIEYEGAIYHVIQRGTNREYIFEEHRWKKNLLQEIIKSIEVDQMDLFAFVIMGNHYHLALRTEKTALSKIMHRINSNFGRYYNRDRGRTGSVFEGRYKAFPIENENYLLSVIRYIHRNPVRAAICSSVDEYSWSSDQAYRGKGFGFVHTDVLLSILASNRDQAKHEYNRLMGLEDDYDENAIKYLGTEEFWSQKTYKPEPKVEKKDLETLLLESVADANGISLIKKGSKQRALMEYKRDFVQRAFASGYSMEEIGKYIAISGVAVGKILRKLES